MMTDNDPDDTVEMNYNDLKALMEESLKDQYNEILELNY